jgi:TrmH family RNA methyltransferase
MPLFSALSCEIYSLRLAMTSLNTVQQIRLKDVAKAARSGRPTADGFIVAEGPHLLEEAQTSSWSVDQVLCTDKAISRFRNLFQNAPVTKITTRALASMTTTGTSQGVVSVLRPRHWTWKDVMAGRTLAVILDGIQDPGNVGAIVRSAEAFGATGVIFSDGCARVSNGKVLRAAAGSLFRLPYVEAVAREEIRRQLVSAGLRVYALAASDGTAVTNANLLDGCALVAGSEGSGISSELLSAAEALKIQTQGVESLNAAIACSIVLFEAARQRRSG